MMPKSLRVLVTIALAVSCESPLAAQARVDIEWSTAGARGDLLSYVGGMAETASGNVIITDQRNSVVYSFEPSTASTAVISRAGQGPNETMLPSLAASHPNGGVIVHDVGNGRLLEYDANGAFRRIRPLLSAVQNPKGFAVLADGSFVLSGARFGSPFCLFKFDSSGSIIASAIRTAPSRDPVAVMQVSGGALYPLPDGSLLYSNSAPHGISRITPDFEVRSIASDGQLVPPIADNFHKPTTAPDGRPAMAPQWDYDQSRMIAELPSGNILNIVTRYYRGDSVWEVWSPGASLISRTVVPRAYRPFNMTRKGLVLASLEDPVTGEVTAFGLRIVGLK